MASAATASPSTSAGPVPAAGVARRRTIAQSAPPEAYFVVSAIFHYLGPAFAVLLFARVEVLGVAFLRVASAAAVFALWRRPWRALARLGRDQRRTLLAWGALLAVIVFALMVWLVPRPIRWFRIVAVIALLLSLIPDLLLGFGGDARRMGTSMVSPFSRFGGLFFPAQQGGGRPPGGPSPGDALPALPWDRVLILMLMHTAVAVVCIVLLTTLTRDPSAADRHQG